MCIPVINRTALVFFCCVLLSACSQGPAKTGLLPVLGKDPIPNAALIEERDLAFLHWAEQGSRDLTVLHIDTSLGFAEVPDAIIEQARSAVHARDRKGLLKSAGAFGGGGISSANQLFGAVKLGLVKKIYWIIPFRMFDYVDAERRLRHLLRAQAPWAERRQIEEFRLNGGCLSGRLAGIELSLCGPETLPPLREPVALSIGAGFFPAFSGERDMTVLRGIWEFSEKIKLREIRVATATVASSPETGGGMSAVQRYIGAEVVETLKNPLLLKTAPPEQWALRDSADAMLAEGSLRLLRERLALSLKKFPEDRAFMLFDAVARLRLRGTADAASADAFGKLCAEDEAWCHGLVSEESLLFTAGKPGAAEALLRKALQVRPDWQPALIRHAIHRCGQKNYPDADALFRKAQATGDTVSLQLLWGECALFSGKNAEALSHYDAALKGVREVPWDVLAREYRSPLEAGRKLYEQKADTRRAATIREILDSRQ